MHGSEYRCQLSLHWFATQPQVLSQHNTLVCDGISVAELGGLCIESFTREPVLKVASSLSHCAQHEGYLVADEHSTTFLHHANPSGLGRDWKDEHSPIFALHTSAPHHGP